MDVLSVEGGRRLAGRVHIEGAKNAGLPACVASLLVDEGVVIHRVPQLRDVSTILFTLGSLGKRVVRNGGSVVISEDGPLAAEASAYSVRKMRASFLVLGPLVGRLGRAVVPLPGGCSIGARPVDLHLLGLRALGAHVEETASAVTVTAERLRGARVEFSFPSVGATEQLLMTGTLASGVTEIVNAAVEPEVLDLVELLRAMGAEIEVEGRTIRVAEARLHGAEHTLIPDRIEAGTLLLAGVATRGAVTVVDVRPDHLEPFLAVLRAMGVDVVIEGGDVTASAAGGTRGVDIRTAPHPGFPTDLHPQTAAALTCAAGTSRIIETVFEGRYTYVDGMRAMGAQISTDGRTATITGVSGLRGAAVEAPDIRAGAALVLGALAAQGTSAVSGLDKIERGYDKLPDKLQSLGANVERREA
ncbi:MAG: UDP-N-acetylglucosamine 1-carboxyvinyltransferase [Candidatus Bipolaricaulota bacterium]|nr:UDP-N-acetylglucosamine 1-carboxyvinyltransferase [Candidatus Bipolaricaulota bacterium]